MRISLGICACLLIASSAPGAEREVDPTFLHRFLPTVADQPADITTSSCRYKPAFGAGDAESRALHGIARFGEIAVAPGGESKRVSYPAEEQVYVVLSGSGVLHYGGENVPIRKNDFMYLPPGVEHGVSSSGEPCRLVVMGFKIPGGMAVEPPPKLLLANIDDVKKQTVGGHPASTLYQLLMGDTKSTRDKLAAAHVLTSLFIMSIEPGGTNFPHHHEREEEIYLVLDGNGDMVAGGGMDGVEGRHSARAGDAYFFRLNCTVGFYASNAPGAQTAHILAVRSWFPGMEPGMRPGMHRGMRSGMHPEMPPNLQKKEE